MKKISDKKNNKTDADHYELAHLEFIGGLWLHNGEPCIPSDAWEATGKKGAKKIRKGPKADIGISVAEHTPLIYDGPRNPEEMWKTGDWESQGGMAFVTMARVQKNKVPRTRCRFDEWSAVVDIQYRDDVFNESEVLDIYRIAGDQCGLGDWVPKFGLFTIEKI